MLGINGWEFVVLAVVALVVIGPDKLPGFVSEAGRIIRQVRRMADEAQADVRDHLGPEFADINLSELNPRSFVQKHLLDDGLDEDLRGMFDLGLNDRPTDRHSGTTGTGSHAPMNLSKSTGPDLGASRPAQHERAAYEDGDIT